jgi:DNA polymerase III delta subunit
MSTMIPWQEAPDVVVLTGSEEFLIQQHITQAGRTLSDHEVFVFHGKEDADAVRDILWSSSFVPVMRIIVIKAANRFPDSQVLREYCDNPDSANVVLLCTEGKTAKWYRDLKRNESIDCTPLKPWDLPGWVSAYARQKGYALSAPLAKALVSNVGTDMYALSSELKKIFLGMGSKREVEGSDITKVLVQHEALKPWLITEAWASRKCELADRLLTLYLYQTSDPGAVLSLVAIFQKKLQALLVYLSGRTSGLSDSVVQSILKVSPKQMATLEGEAASWQLDALRESYVEMCAIECAAKSGQDALTRLHLFMYLPQKDL